MALPLAVRALTADLQPTDKAEQVQVLVVQLLPEAQVDFF